MRVISGMAKGKRLETLDGLYVRPTADRVKEALFSIIQHDIQNAVFLDLFAGSGQMGIEALSRGASRAVFVDNDRRAVQIVKNNIEKCGFINESKIIKSESAAFIESTDNLFDIAFLDPPYSSGLINKILPLTAAKMCKNGLIIYESPSNDQKENKEWDIPGLNNAKIYKYGRTSLLVYRMGMPETVSIQ